MDISQNVSHSDHSSSFQSVLSRIHGSFQNKQIGLVTGPIIIRIYLEHVLGNDI